METFFLALYLGGLIPAYYAARANGHERFMSCLNAFVWPSDVGWHIALKYCADEKGPEDAREQLLGEDDQ